jgi:hypothetical protein
MSAIAGGVAVLAILGGFAVALLTVSAAIAVTKRPHAEHEETGTAARDGDDLVVTVGSPLPPECLLCGEPSSYRVPPSALLRNLGAHPDAALALSGMGLPLCASHFHTQQRFERDVAIGATGAFLVFVVNVGALLLLGGGHSALMLLPGALAFAAVFAYSVTRRPGHLFVGRATVRHVRIHGVAQMLLDTLPSVTAESNH